MKLFFSFFRLILEIQWKMHSAYAKMALGLVTGNPRKLKEGTEDLRKVLQRPWASLSYGRIVRRFKVENGSRRARNGGIQRVLLKNPAELPFRWFCYVEADGKGVLVRHIIPFEIFRQLPLLSYFIDDLLDDVFIPWSSVVISEPKPGTVSLRVEGSEDSLFFRGAAAASVKAALVAYGIGARDVLNSFRVIEAP